jgi:hypothetical protein
MVAAAALVSLLLEVAELLVDVLLCLPVVALELFDLLLLLLVKVNAPPTTIIKTTKPAIIGPLPMPGPSLMIYKL